MWRRAHLAALAAAAGLLLLLLHALPPVPPAAPHPRPRPLAASAPPPAPAAPPGNTTTAPPPAPPRTNVTELVDTRPAPSSAAPPAPPPRPRDPRVVLTRDVYVAGHSRPHPELCPALGARLQLLILVTSAPSHARARDAVRLTWGHYAARTDIALAFVLGAPPAHMQAALEQEDALYGDLIVGNFVDSYSNLTLKTISMLEWADSYCPRVPRLLKTDDDMFINVPRLLEFMSARRNATRTIWGKLVRRSLPKRTTKSKYYVSVLQYPHKVFPDFTTGPAYLVTADCVRELVAGAPALPYLRLEDVFVTGVLAARLGVRREHAAQFYNKKVAPHPCAIQRGVAIHMVRYHEQFDMWRKLLDGKTKCPAAPAA